MIEKVALYFAPVPDTFSDLSRAVEQQSGLTVQTTVKGCHWSGRDLDVRFELATSAAEAAQRVHAHYYNAILVDCRHLPNSMVDASAQEQALHEFLDVLESERDRERRYPLRRIIVLVGGADRERTDRLIFTLGQRHVGGYLRDRSLAAQMEGSSDDVPRARLIEQLWQFLSARLAGVARGKKAICTAGGGITGIYYELGVLKCLHDAFGGYPIWDFDMYFGISAGALVSAFIANGFHINQLIANIGEMNARWPHRLELKWSHLNVGELPRRVGLVQRNLLRDLRQLLRGGGDFNVMSLVSSYSVLFGPMFDSGELEAILREQFTRPRHTNDFRKLRAKLYIGATDQDRREHVLLGDAGYEDVPISKAVQASSAVHPFFPSVQIHGRYYTDGAITRTSNIKQAIQKGADLIFVVDPFLPLISEEAGFNARQGNLWVMQQDIKTLAYTRFAQISEEVLRQNPHVNCYTFVPGNRMREMMAQNPLAARNFHPLVCEAYNSTYRRLAQLEYKIAPELAAHGINLDLRPVAAKVEEIRRLDAPDARVLIVGGNGLDDYQN